MSGPTLQPTQSVSDRVLAVVERLATGERPIPLHAPSFSELEEAAVAECVKSGWVSTAGNSVTEFERRLAEFSGVEAVVATVNGTAALEVALRIVGVRPGTEVVIPSLTFAATAAAVCHLGAVPHFVDVDRTTLGVGPDGLRARLEAVARRSGASCVNRVTGRTISAIVPMHTFGHPVDIEGVLDVGGEFDLPIVEDAAESLGSCRAGRHCGSWGKAAAVSFNGNKIITTGGGGAVYCSTTDLATRARHLTTTARVPHPWEYVHDEVGYNYRMPNLNAALGCAQLQSLPKFIAQKRKLAAWYREALAGIDGLSLIWEPDGAASNFWLNAVLFERPEDARSFIEVCHASAIQVRPVWQPLHTLPPYRAAPAGDMDVTAYLATRLVNLPSSPGLRPIAQ